MADLTNKQKQDWAKVLYLKENLLQKEIAAKVGCTEKSIGKWIKDGNWEMLKSSIVVTKEQELRRLYMQINQLNNAIEARPDGERFATAKEADMLSKYAATIRNLETETSAADAIEVCMRVINFIKKDDLAKAQEISEFFEGYIKTLFN
jgi:DNA-binding XRE family transcriptional regulator